MSRMLLVLPALLLGACVTSDGRIDDPKGAAKANIDLGVAYLKQGNLGTAREKLERAAKQDPKNPEVYWAMASLHERLNQPDDADANYRKAIKLAPEKSEITNTYAAFLCGRGEVDRALQMFDKVVADKLYPTPWVAAANAGVCLRDNKRNADALRYFERALVLRPDFVDGVVGLADLQITQGQPEASRKTVDKYLAGGAKNPDVLLVGVRAAVAQKECGSARVYATVLRRDFPNATQTTGALLKALGTCSNPVN